MSAKAQIQYAQATAHVVTLRAVTAAHVRMVSVVMDTTHVKTSMNVLRIQIFVIHWHNVQTLMEATSVIVYRDTKAMAHTVKV